jgi:tetratricopeptide (TPR) repeat protein
VRELKNVTVEKAWQELTHDWKRDRALHLLLILLDPLEDLQDREEAAKYTSELVGNDAVYAFVRDRLYTAPLPGVSDLRGAIRIALTTGETLAALLAEVGQKQRAIHTVHAALEAINVSTFGGQSAKAKFIRRVRMTSASRLLAGGVESGVTGVIFLNVLQNLLEAPNARAVVTEWVRELGLVKLPEANLEPEPDTDDEPKDAVTYSRPKSVHQTFVNVQHQKAAIKLAIERGDLSLARKFIDELVQTQTTGNQNPEYASKSLCDLSQTAKHFGNPSLQLELAERATEVCPSDGWAHSQVADAFLGLGQVDNARAALNRAIENGHPSYAATGYARILRLQGKLPEALAAYEAAIRDFAGEKFAWAGKAEVLREMWRLDDALRAYNDAVDRFDDPIILCGRANVLKEMGRFSEAIVEYRAAEHVAEENDPAPRDGLADVLFVRGDLQAALSQYLANIERFSGDSVAHCGAAEVMLAMGDEAGALAMYAKAVQKFPHLPIPVSGRANAFVELGRYYEAEQAY